MRRNASQISNSYCTAGQKYKLIQLDNDAATAPPLINDPQCAFNKDGQFLLLYLYSLLEKGFTELGLFLRKSFNFDYNDHYITIHDRSSKYTQNTSPIINKPSTFYYFDTFLFTFLRKLQ